MYGYFMNMVNYSIGVAVKAVSGLFDRITEDGINRVTEDNEQRIIQE